MLGKNLYIWYGELSLNTAYSIYDGKLGVFFSFLSFENVQEKQKTEEETC